MVDPLAPKQLTVVLDEGRSLRAQVAGRPGDPLVLFHHGTPYSNDLYGPQVMAALELGLRLCTYSRPGYCGSDRVPGRTVADCAADSAAVADALGADEFFSLGVSGGGPHALACAALTPDRVPAAATIAGVAPWKSEGLDWLDGMGDENQDEFGAILDGPEALQSYLEPEVAGLAGVTADQIREALGDLISAADVDVMADGYAEFLAMRIRNAVADGIWGWFDDDVAFVSDWGFDIGTIEPPVTVWQGDEDRMVPLAHGRWLAAHVAGAHGRFESGGGHISLEVRRFGAILDGLTSA